MLLPPNKSVSTSFAQPASGYAKIRVVSDHKTVVISPVLTAFAREHEFTIQVPAGSEWKLVIDNVEPVDVNVYWTVTEMRLVDVV